MCFSHGSGCEHRSFPNIEVLLDSAITVMHFNLFLFLYYRYVPGLNDELARSIIEHRKRHGRFVNREMIRNKVHGFGPEAFTQSVGFLKIYPENRSAFVFN